jgi:hypothetical protein
MYVLRSEKSTYFLLKYLRMTFFTLVQTCEKPLFTLYETKTNVPFSLVRMVTVGPDCANFRLYWAIVKFWPVFETVECEKLGISSPKFGQLIPRGKVMCQL